MSKKILLDAGHYGNYNRSPAVPVYYESKVMWKLHLLLKTALQAYGFTVGTTRTDQNKDMEVTQRGKLAGGYDILLSLHSNAAGSAVNETVDYPVCYVPLNGQGDALGKKLASAIQTVMNTKQSGRISTKKGNNGDYYGVIRGAVSVGVPGIIVEHSFHTQTAATNWLLNDANLQRLADREAAVIAEHYGVGKPSGTTQDTAPAPTTPPTTNPVLRKGDKGEDVKTLQKTLNLLGYALTVDGDFGALTETAVKDFQRKYTLVADGICGGGTWAALLDKTATVPPVSPAPVPMPTPKPTEPEQITPTPPTVPTQPADKGDGEPMTQIDFDRMMERWMDAYNPMYKTLEDVPVYWREEAQALVDGGFVVGDGVNALGMRHETLKAVIVAGRMLGN